MSYNCSAKQHKINWAEEHWFSTRKYVKASSWLECLILGLIYYLLRCFFPVSSLFQQHTWNCKWTANHKADNTIIAASDNTFSLPTGGQAEEKPLSAVEQDHREILWHVLWNLFNLSIFQNRWKTKTIPIFVTLLGCLQEKSCSAGW